MTLGMPRNMLIYSILCWHHRLSFPPLARSTSPLPFDQRRAAHSGTNIRKSLNCNDKGAPARFRSRAEVAPGTATRPICIR